jgi:hypothetical protein
MTIRFIENPVIHLADISIEDIEYLINEYMDILQDPDNDPLQGDTYHVIRKVYNNLLIIRTIAKGEEDPNDVRYG